MIVRLNIGVYAAQCRWGYVQNEITLDENLYTFNAYDAKLHFFVPKNSVFQPNFNAVSKLKAK